MALKINGWERGSENGGGICQEDARFLRWGEGAQPLFAPLEPLS